MENNKLELLKVVEKARSMPAPEKSSLGIKIDKTLIKQFARRIYGTIKTSIIYERKRIDIILQAVYGDTDKGN